AREVAGPAGLADLEDVVLTGVDAGDVVVALGAGESSALADGERAVVGVVDEDRPALEAALAVVLRAVGVEVLELLALELGGRVVAEVLAGRHPRGDESLPTRRSSDLAREVAGPAGLADLEDVVLTGVDAGDVVVAL